MGYLSKVDFIVIGIYFICLIGLGMYLKKRASASLEDYLIGGRKIPWWAMGISGMASWVDITGTMIIVSFIFMLGPRGLYIEGFRGAAGLVLVIAMLWTGKWHRRSKCITQAEWMIFRFGDGPAGRSAQLLMVVAAILLTTGLIAYLVKGAGLFLSTFLPYSPMVCALVLIGIATIYTMISGFYGVVFTDMFQAIIILVGVFCICFLAFDKLAGCSDLGQIAFEVTGNKSWTSSVPAWETSFPKGYQGYRFLMLFALFYLLKEMLRGSASGGDPKYFGARSDRECGLLSFLWGWMMMFRWPLVLSFAILGLFLVKDLFPNQKALTEATVLIKTEAPNIAEAQWDTLISDIVHRPEKFSEKLITGLQSSLGEKCWSQKVQLLSYHGTVNPERILPGVLLFSVPEGLRGLLMVALLAAAMSTFDSTVNMTTGYFTSDCYKKYLRPKASTRELIYVSWVFIAIIVAIGFLFAYFSTSINNIWGWIMSGLCGGFLVSTILRLYWWRFNGVGFAVSTAAGLCAAVGQRIICPDLSEVWQLVFVFSTGLIGAIVGTFCSTPTNPKVLEHFYRTTRPFGLWKPLEQKLSPSERASFNHEHRTDLLSLPFALGWLITILLLPMQLLIRQWNAAGITLGILLISLVGLYIFWYRNLPSANVE